MNKIKDQKSKVESYRSEFLRLKTFWLSLIFSILFVFPVLAQIDEEPPADIAPPAMKLLTKVEKDTLQAQDKNLKKRTKVSLELMESRLLKAEKFNIEGRYGATLTELAGFNAVLDNQLDFLVRNDRGKSDRSFINFEIYLRKQVTRLEAIRREMPSRYGYHVGKLMVSVREARSKAVEPIFGDPVTPTASKKP